jgi:hypothetical protein
MHYKIVVTALTEERFGYVSQNFLTESRNRIYDKSGLKITYLFYNAPSDNIWEEFDLLKKMNGIIPRLDVAPVRTSVRRY